MRRSVQKELQMDMPTRYVDEVVLPEGLPDLLELIGARYRSREITVKHPVIITWDGDSVVIPREEPFHSLEEEVMMGLLVTDVMQYGAWAVPIGQLFDSHGLGVVCSFCGGLPFTNSFIDAVWSMQADGDVDIVTCQGVQYVIPQPHLVARFLAAPEYYMFWLSE
jgi:hypothetical protein